MTDQTPETVPADPTQPEQGAEAVPGQTPQSEFTSANGPAPDDTSWADQPAPGTGDVQGGSRAQRMLRWFEHAHLPPHLAEVASHLKNVAEVIVNGLPDSPELHAGLRKLLEAKDCFVRAAIDLYEGKSDFETENTDAPTS